MLAPYQTGKLRLTDGTHGVRLHGFTDFGWHENIVHYARDRRFAAAILREQINLTAALSDIAGLDRSRVPSLFTIHLGRSRGDRAAELETAAQAIADVMPLAQEKNVYVCVENLWEGLIDSYSLGSDLSDFARINERIGDQSHWGMTFDLAHALIHYRGDVEKVKQELESFDLLSRIIHCHITAPAPDYLQKVEFPLIMKHFSALAALPYLLWRTPDSQGGFLPFGTVHPAELVSLRGLLTWLAARAPFAQVPWAVATVELGGRVWGTPSGATVADVAYTLDCVRDRQ